MVLEYYKLREQPFGVTPDPRYLYPSATHQEALASLLYGIREGRGFVALIGMPGMGKTTLLFRALDQLRNSARVVFLFQTICTPIDFLWAVLSDLGVHETGGSLVELQSKLNEVLTEQSRYGKPLIIVIDEAQNLNDSVLELVRMLSNFETAKNKLIQIILSGQPQLAEKLASPELVQLRQRISIFARLKPLTPQETLFYVEYRIRLAGRDAEPPVFTQAALSLIAQYSEGIPRNINNLCFNALSLGCAMKRRMIDCDIIREVVADLDLEPLREKKSIATRSDDGGAKDALAYISSASARSLLPKWLPQLAIACALVLVLGWAFLHSRQWVAPQATVRVNDVVAPFGPASSSSLSVEENLQPASPADVLVMPGQTLSQICIENFGDCNMERLQEIHKLNPWLSNLNHIESGQRIRIAAVEKFPAVTRDTVRRSDKTVERITP